MEQEVLIFLLIWDVSLSPAWLRGESIEPGGARCGRTLVLVPVLCELCETRPHDRSFKSGGGGKLGAIWALLFDFTMHEHQLDGHSIMGRVTDSSGTPVDKKHIAEQNAVASS